MSQQNENSLKTPKKSKSIIGCTSNSEIIFHLRRPAQCSSTAAHDAPVALPAALVYQTGASAVFRPNLENLGLFLVGGLFVDEAARQKRGFFSSDGVERRVEDEIVDFGLNIVNDRCSAANGPFERVFAEKGSKVSLFCPGRSVCSGDGVLAVRITDTESLKNATFALVLFLCFWGFACFKVFLCL